MTTEPTSAVGLRSQIPHGVQDRFLVEAARRRQAEARLSECFARWGYQEVIPPTFEYQENLAVGASAELQQAMYRFFDREGHILALRTDFTPQIARMAATKLFDRPMPLRFYYVGSVFRHEEPQAGRKREFTQAGIELVGVDSPAADAEVVALAIGSLEALDLHDFQVNLGIMAFFRALTREIPPGLLGSVRRAVDRRNRARLGSALAEAGVHHSLEALLCRLPDLIGDAEVLDEAWSLTTDLPSAGEAQAALDRLREIYHLLQAYGVADRVILDLAEVRGMDYYTGITFRGVAPGLGWPVISGGRYDDLVAGFGRPLAAVGFGLGLERALLVQARQGVPYPAIAPHVLVQCCDHAACLALVLKLRQRGLRVEVEPLGLAGRELAEQARLRGIPRTLSCASGQWQLAEATRLPGYERVLHEADILQEAEGWVS